MATMGSREHTTRTIDTATDDLDDGYVGGFRWSFALGAAAFLAMALFWVWVFQNGASVSHPDEFDDATFIEQAESLCSKRQAIITSIPNGATAEDAIERSGLVQQGTRQLELMVSELHELAEMSPPTDPKGAEILPLWLADYEIYLNDRRVYADILATGEDPPFLISGNATGDRVTDGLTTFAEVNNMRSCGPSGDV